MRERIVSKETLAKRLLKKFGQDEPIFTSEILSVWKEYSRPRVFQILKEMVNEGKIIKKESGVYYFPLIIERTGRPMSLSRTQVLEKKFLFQKEEIYGYYSSLKLLNGLHLITQMPFDIEMVSSNTSAGIRKVDVNVTVRRSKVQITKNNVHALMLLEAFKEMRRPLYKKEVKWMREFVQVKNIKKEDVLRYSRHFPAHTLDSILRTGIDNVFA
ncbi:MAG: hypothetical protein FWD37_05450 [Methanomassiliicoccaceae archaeon]|nr:hypothetical protein [Methanomassiliicoccaceae archaeon]